MSDYSMKSARIHLPFTPEDCAELSDILEEKKRAHVAAKTLRNVREKMDVCIDCRGSGKRVSLTLAKVIPCQCRPEAFAEFFAALAYEYEVIRPIVAEEGGYGEELCTPPTLRSGEVDPWDLPADELNETAPLPREVPAYWGKDRGDFDPLDDRSDINPFTKTSKP